MDALSKSSFIFVVVFVVVLSFSCQNLHAYQEKSSQSPKLGLVAIFRDDERFLKEWIEYYRLQGVDRFYLYNNLSEDKYKKVLRPYIRKGIVRLFDWNIESQNVRYWNHVQVTAYANGMAQAREDGVHWLIVVDTDEFMVPLKHKRLLDLVFEYDNTDVGMLSALWIMFGTSNIVEIPKSKLMIETLLYNGGSKSAVEEKSILHTQRANTNGPHYGTCLEGFRPVHLPLELIQVNHYWSRDEKYFYEYKVPRRMIWGWSQEVSENFMSSFNKEEFLDWSDSIQKFVPILRRNMGFRKSKDSLVPK